MQGIAIRDGTEPGGKGGLEFDLAEILSALGPRVSESHWTSSRLSYVSRDETDIDILEAVATGNPIAGSDLVKALPQLLQVIDGEFRGFSGDSAPWVILRAVDSSWWEVWSESLALLQAIRSRFRIVDDLPA